MPKPKTIILTDDQLSMVIDAVTILSPDLDDGRNRQDELLELLLDVQSE